MEYLFYGIYSGIMFGLYFLGHESMVTLMLIAGIFVIGMKVLELEKRM